MASENPLFARKSVEPPRRGFRVPAALYAAAAAVAVTALTTPSSEEPGIMFRTYQRGINFIDSHPSIKDTGVGRTVRNGLVSLAIGNALSSGGTLRQDIPIGRAPITVMVENMGYADGRNDSAPYNLPTSAKPYLDGLDGNSTNSF